MARSQFVQGIQDATPIILAYFPIAMTFGVISTSNGIPWIVTFLISAWVYAGGAQFMLVSLALSGTSPESTIVTVLLVNLRHFLYGTTLGPAFHKWAESKKWLFSFGLTDEVFAVASSQIRETNPSPAYQIPFAFSCYGSWLAGTAIGASVGRVVPSSVSDILAFALPALFLALLMIGKKSVPYFIAAILGAACSFTCARFHLGSLGIVAGAVFGATCGMYVHQRMTGQRTTGSNVNDATLDT